MDKAGDLLRRSGIRLYSSNHSPCVTDLRLLQSELLRLSSCHSAAAESGLRVAADLHRWSQHAEPTAGAAGARVQHTAELFLQLERVQLLSSRRLSEQLRTVGGHVKKLEKLERRLSASRARLERCHKAEKRQRAKLRHCSSHRQTERRERRLAELELETHSASRQVDECVDEVSAARHVRIKQALSLLAAGYNSASVCSQLVFKAVGEAAADLPDLPEQLPSPADSPAVGIQATIECLKRWLHQCSPDGVSGSCSVPSPLSEHLPSSCTDRITSSSPTQRLCASSLYPDIDLPLPRDICTCNRFYTNASASTPTAPPIYHLNDQFRAVKLSSNEGRLSSD